MSNTTIPAPIAWAPSPYWDGNDGSWNSFIVQVGTPPQDFRVYPSTAGQETWIPIPDGCLAADPSDPGYCGFLRGTLPVSGANSSGFESNTSSTWDAIGPFELDAQEAQLGYTGSGAYGFDTVVWGNESSSPNLTRQVVAGIADPSYWLGVAGIGPKSINFTNFNDPIPCFMSNLVNRSIIPSLSWGYTAGAAYRNKTPASLTLGGYDTNRFDGPGLTVSMNEDNSRPIQVGVQRILGHNTQISGDSNLLPTATYHFIDSTVPHIWLPDDAIDNFVSAFGLEYDNKTDLFTINDTMREKNLNLNPTITFVLSASTTVNSGDVQNIELPYAAFDLQATYPFYPNDTNYFPIRRAANDSQYTIGRTFLQEAYLIADYDRQNFTIAQTSFSNPQTEHLVAVQRPVANSTATSTASATPTPAPSGLSGGAIAGIVVGVVLGVALFAVGAWFLLRRRKQKRFQAAAAAAAAAAEAAKNEEQYTDDKKPQPPFLGSELPSESQINEAPGGSASPYHEADGGKAKPYEIDSRGAAAEVQGDSARWGSGGAQEMPAPGAFGHHTGLAEAPGSQGIRAELYGSDVPEQGERGRLMGDEPS